MIKKIFKISISLFLLFDTCLYAAEGIVTANPVTADNIVNASEASEEITLTGTATEGDISEGDDVAAVPFNPALNQRGVCLVMQDNPRPKECIRHGDTREIMDADQG